MASSLNIPTGSVTLSPAPFAGVKAVDHDIADVAYQCFNTAEAAMSAVNYFIAGGPKLAPVWVCKTLKGKYVVGSCGMDVRGISSDDVDGLRKEFAEIRAYVIGEQGRTRADFDLALAREILTNTPTPADYVLAAHRVAVWPVWKVSRYLSPRGSVAA